MMFQTAKTALLALLATGAASGGYSVVGSEMQSHDADDIANLSHVEVTYEDGDFPKSRGSMGSGPSAHDVVYQVKLLVVSASAVDLATLNNPSATRAQLATALAQNTKAADAAETKMDALISCLWNLIMQPANQAFGLTGQVANRWIPHIQKDPVGTSGAYASQTASLNVSCTVMEQPTTVVGVQGRAIVDNVILTSDKTGINLDSAVQGTKAGT
jgi:hypothetical protein